MISPGLIKGIGIGATVLGMGATLVSDWVAEQKMKEQVKETVDEALAKRDEEETEA